jgi:hypothetical protein
MVGAKNRVSNGSTFFQIAPLVLFSRLNGVLPIPEPSQKNGGYALEHRYSEHPVASKIFYLLLQIAHLIAQLMERGSLFRKAFPNGVGSAKNIAFRLLEAWRNLQMNPEVWSQLLDIRVQIRFAPP